VEHPEYANGKPSITASATILLVWLTIRSL
jgi:hypothetical protein